MPSYLKIKKISHDSRGDTIVEVLLTMAVLAFVLGASYVTANRSLQRGVDSSIRTQAITQTQQQVEVLKVISASDPSRLAPYKSDSKPFCINPTTTNFTDLGPANPTCDAGNGIRLVTTYSTVTKTFTVKAEWPSQSSSTITNQTSIKYKTHNSFRDTPDAAYTAPTEGGPAAISSSGVSLTANPEVILPGGRTNLSWTTIYGTSTNCIAQTPVPNVGGWNGNKGSSGGPEQTNILNEDTTFSLRCTRAVGGAQDVGSVVAKVESVTMYADSPSIPYGGSTTLNWVSKWTNNCNLGAGNLPTSGSQSTGVLYVDRTYTITCNGPAGAVSRTVTVSVSGAPRVLTFTSTAGKTAASPIPYGSATNITWSSENATGCYSAQLGWLGTSGSITTGNLTATRAYGLACYNAASVWTDNSNTTVYVAPAPTVTSFSASPSTVPYGGASTISWTSANATGCYSPQAGWAAPSGSFNTGALTVNRQYSISCYNAVNVYSASSYVIVTVNPAPRVAYLYPSPNPVVYNGSSNIYWSSYDATGCHSPQQGYIGTIGNFGTGARTGNTQYSVACYNAAGAWSAYSYTTLSVDPAPSVSYFYASPNPIAYNSSSNMYWGSANASGCYSPQYGYIGTSGAFGTGARTSNTQFSISCYNAAGAWGGTAYADLTVNPAPPADPPPPYCTSWAGGDRPWNDANVYLHGGGSGCGYWRDTVVDWNGGFMWNGPHWVEACYEHTQYGGTDPWGWISSSRACP